MIELVLSNIIGNAIKYSKEHQKVNIDLYEEYKFIIIDISDSGIGIPKMKLIKYSSSFTELQIYQANT